MLVLALISLLYVGACGLLFVFQRALLYHPTGRHPDVPSFVLTRDDARIVVSTNAVESQQAVLYFGGNGEDVSWSVDVLNRAFPGAGVYAMHYRGYGGSTGHPSERALVADAIGLFDQVSPTHPHIVLVGRSLGSGVAVQLAAARPVERLVLVTPYDSITEVAATRFPMFPIRWLLRDRFESWSYARHLTIPTTLVVAGEDRLIPAERSRKLAAAFPPGVAHVVVIAGATHNDIADFPGYIPALNDVAASRAPSGGPS